MSVSTTVPAIPARAKNIAPPVAFQKLDEMKPGETVTALAYGGSKVGKTWLAGTTGSRTLYISTGDGIDTIMSPLFRKLVPGFNPTVVDIREKLNIAGIPDMGIVAAFDLMCDAIDYALSNFADQFDTVVIDELSATRRHALFKGLELSQTLGRSRTWDKTKLYEIILPAGQDFGAEMSLIEQFLTGTISLCERHKKHLLVLAHQRYLMVTVKDEKGNPIFGEPKRIKEIRPAVTGAQFPDTISALFDNVWHAEKVGGGDQGTAYRLRVIGDEGDELTHTTGIVAGTRHAGILPTIIVNPNFQEIVEAIKLGQPLMELRKKRGVKATGISTPVVEQPKLPS